MTGPRSILLLVLFTASAVAQVPESAFEKDPWPMNGEGPVKVFILAGQSNMQGHAALRTLEYLIYNQETAADYQHWKDRNGAWTERRDVWIWTTDGARAGNLRPGFGENEMKMGPELGFGWAIGEGVDEQVLLIKTCWGGRSVKKDFLSPGSALPPEEELRQDLERLKRGKRDATLDDVKAVYGKAYRDMIAHTREVLGDIKKHFSWYNPRRGYELAGFVFFQGFNDMIDGAQREEKYASYTKRLAQMIKDLRRDLNAPRLPVVIGELGTGGKRGDFQAAQAAVAALSELEANVRFVKTCEFWEPEVEELVNQGVWKGKDWVKFYNVGSDRAYHYLGSARIYYRMGNAFGEAMLELLRK